MNLLNIDSNDLDIWVSPCLLDSAGVDNRKSSTRLPGGQVVNGQSGSSELVIVAPEKERVA